jgi:hypothetical protein
VLEYLPHALSMLGVRAEYASTRRFHGGRCVGIFGSTGLLGSNSTGIVTRTVRHLVLRRGWLSGVGHTSDQRPATAHGIMKAVIPAPRS